MGCIRGDGQTTHRCWDWRICCIHTIYSIITTGTPVHWYSKSILTTWATTVALSSGLLWGHGCFLFCLCNLHFSLNIERKSIFKFNLLVMYIHIWQTWADVSLSDHPPFIHLSYSLVLRPRQSVKSAFVWSFGAIVWCGGQESYSFSVINAGLSVLVDFGRQGCPREFVRQAKHPGGPAPALTKQTIHWKGLTDFSPTNTR